jgi:hypothetical protein
MKTYKIGSKETLQSWTTELVSDEHLMSQEGKPDLSEYLTSVHDISTDEMKHALIFEILL